MPASVIDTAGNDAQRGRLQRLRTEAGSLGEQQVGAEGRAADFRELVAFLDAEIKAAPTALPAAPYLTAVVVGAGCVLDAAGSDFGRSTGHVKPA